MGTYPGCVTQLQIPSWGGLGGLGTLGLRVGLAVLGTVGAAVLMFGCGGTEQSVSPSDAAQRALTESASTPVPATSSPPKAAATPVLAESTPTTGTPSPRASPTAPPTDAPSTPTPPAAPTPPALPEVFVGGTDDITWRVVEILGSIPSAETMTALGHLVASALVPDEGEGAPQISVVKGQVIGDLGEITLDVVGLADYSILGYRLRIFAHPPEAEGDFTLKTVERTPLCRRGVSGELCL